MDRSVGQVACLTVATLVLVLSLRRARADDPNETWHQQCIAHAAQRIAVESPVVYKKAYGDCMASRGKQAALECQTEAAKSLESLRAGLTRCKEIFEHRRAFVAEIDKSLVTLKPFTDQTFENLRSEDLDSAVDRIRAESSRLQGLADADNYEEDGVKGMAVPAIAGLAKLAEEVAKEVADEKKCRADKKCVAAREAVRAEKKFVQEVLGPLCGASVDLERNRAIIVREKANPSGVVDLSVLHDAGEAIQNEQERIRSLMPAYAATRHHPFGGWRSEPACAAGN
jgi:hypothetical protein